MAVRISYWKLRRWISPIILFHTLCNTFWCSYSVVTFSTTGYGKLGFSTDSSSMSSDGTSFFLNLAHTLLYIIILYHNFVAPHAGDLVPLSRPARLFTCFYALAGVACLGIALGILGNSVIEAERNAMDRARNLSQSRALSLFQPAAAAAERSTSSNNNDAPSSSPPTGEDDKVLHTGVSLKHIGLEFVAVIALLLTFATLLGRDPGINAAGWDHLGDALYFAIVTGTVGSTNGSEGRNWNDSV